MNVLKKVLPISMALGLIFTACEKDENSNSVSSSTQASSFKVKMTDAPGDYAALNVEITGVEVYRENEGWISLSNEAQYINVIDLTNGAETTLAFQGNVEAGTYTKLKLSFGDQNTLQVNSDVSLAGLTLQAMSTTTLDWNGPKEVEIVIEEQVDAFSEGEVLLDFQVAQSIKEGTQSFVIDPMITVIEDANTGVQGEVEGSADAVVLLSNGEDTLSTYLNAEGQFLLRGVESGMYDLIIQTAKDSLINSLNRTKIEQVVVSEGQISQVGTIQF